jgi:hypothetical protein
MTYQELQARYEILVNRKNTVNYDRITASMKGGTMRC